MIFLLLMLLSQCSTERLQERLLFGQLAQHDLLVFAQLNTPQAQDVTNPNLSRYQWERHHRVIADALASVERGKINRLEIELPPRHGKSELSVRQFVPWFMGKNPTKSVIVVTHTDTLAKEHGRDVRDYWVGPGFATTFGHKRDATLRDNSMAADRLQTIAGGVVTFTGRGGLGAGVGADLMIFDDFFKNSQEAESVTVREEAWRTFISDCQSRLNNERCPVIMIGSRRHEDDVQGRLFDKTNVHYDEAEASKWTRIRIPALAEDDKDVLGREKDEAIWPAKFGKEFYIAKRNHSSEIVRIDFQTQDMCNPTAQEGNYFKKNWISTYEPSELPDNNHLRFYGSSDHAYRKEQKNDRNCLMVAGIDASDTIWIHPSTWWEKSETDVMVEKLIDLMHYHQTFTWWAARDAISGSLKPFIDKRMMERRVYRELNDSIREDKDLIRRAQSIRNRMAMGMVRFPKRAPWWGEAEKELLAFPNGKHDDLVAALAMLGMGLDQMLKADGIHKKDLPTPGSMAWHSWGQDKNKTVVKGWA